MCFVQNKLLFSLDKAIIDFAAINPDLIASPIVFAPVTASPQA
jgi:hypothetical protein